MWRFSRNDCVPEIWRENKRKSLRERFIAHARMSFAGACASVRFRVVDLWTSKRFFSPQSLLISVLDGQQIEQGMSAMFIIVLGLPRPDPLALCTFGAQKVTTNGMYRLPHAIYYTVASPCQTRDESSIAVRRGFAL